MRTHEGWMRAAACAALLIVVAWTAVVVGQTGSSPLSIVPDSVGLVIREISVRRVAVGAEDPAQGLVHVDAIVGDLLHVRAAVRNDTEDATYAQLRVDFYFTEVVTKEHGLLGTQTVYRLGPGEERLPAISVETNGFTPGFYVFTAAIADPAFGEGSSATRYLVAYTQPETDAYWKVVADRGPRIAELQDLLDPFPSCQYGGVQRSFTLDARNVGTAPLSLSGVDVDVRPQFGDAIGEPLDVTYFPSGLGTPGNFEGRLVVTSIDTEPLERTVKPLPEKLAHFEVLGRGNTTERLQLIVTVTPKGNELVGPSQSVTLPSQEEGAIVFSELDLWQFPQPAVCACSAEDPSICLDVPTTRPAIRPVGYSSELLFHVAVNEDSAIYRLHALDPSTGGSRDVYPLDSVPVTVPVIRFGEGTATDQFAYHTYLGTSAGTVEAYTLLVDKEQEPAQYAWVKGITPGSDTGWQPPDGLIDTARTDAPSSSLHLAALPDEGGGIPVLVVAGPQGIVAIDAATGALVQTVTEEPVQHEPTVVAGVVWYAAGRAVRGVQLLPQARGTPASCAIEFNREIETGLVSRSETIFWGDGQGNLYALDAGAGCSLDTDDAWTMVSIPELGPIVGLTVGLDGGIDGDLDPVVYATDVDGVVGAIEYKVAQRRFEDESRTSQGLRLDGENDLDDDAATVDGTVLTTARNGTSAPPVIWPATDPETVFLVAEFDAESDTEGKAGARWALIGLNVGTDPFEIREVSNWGTTIQFVLKLDDQLGPMLEPVTVGDNLLVVSVPGERLYALKIASLK